jgi:hypothetical protein
MRIDLTAGALLLGVTVAFNAAATSVLYDATKIGGNEWELSYDVSNNSLSVPIQELTIYFNPSVFSNIAVGLTQPTGWNNPIAVQSDPSFLPDLSGYGFFDTVASNSGIPVGGSLAGFTALVDYSGNGMPMSQIFQVVNPTTFATLDQGSTTPKSGGGTGVPEPSSVAVFALGLLVAGAARIRDRALRRGSVSV